MRISDWVQTCALPIYQRRDERHAVLDRPLLRFARLRITDQLVGHQAAGEAAEEDRIGCWCGTYGHRQECRRMETRASNGKEDRKSTRLNSVTNAHLVCRLLLEKKKVKRHNPRHKTTKPKK